MKQKIQFLIGGCIAVAVAAALALVGQVSYNAHQTTSHSDVPVEANAVWSFQPKNAKEVRARANSIVLGEVVSVSRGDDIVTAQPGEPSGSDRIPTTRVTVKVVNSYKGSLKADQQVTLFQTGGSTAAEPAPPAQGEQATSEVQQLQLEGDPAYVQGEQYLLMLEAGPADMLRPVSPEGRFHYDKQTDSLHGVVKDVASNEVSDKKLKSVESVLHG